MSYTPADTTQNATWVGAAAYGTPVLIVVGNWDTTASPTIYPTGIPAGSVGAHAAIPDQFLTPTGFESLTIGGIDTFLDWEYPPPYTVVDATWAGQPAYTAPDTNLTATWEGARFLSVAGIAPGEMGTPTAVPQQLVFPSSASTGAVFGTPLATRDGEYIPPSVVLNGDWTGLGGYTPPQWDQVSGRFGVLQNNIQQFGWQSSQFGATDVRDPSVRPIGFSSYAVGEPEGVVNAAQAALVAGIAPPPQTGPDPDRQLPSPWVTFLTRELSPDSLDPPAFPTTHYLADFYQYIDQAGQGSGPVTPGTPTVDFAVRYIEPPFHYSTVFGGARIVFGLYADLAGWDSAALGDPALLVNTKLIYVATPETDPAGYGDASVRNEFETLELEGWVSSEVNFPFVYNLTQYISDPFYEDEGSVGTAAVENQHRTITTFGHQSSRFHPAGNLVYNAAVPLAPTGIDSFTLGEDTFIAYAIREMSIEGFESFRVSNYNAIYNDARVLAATGWASSALGTPSDVRNLNRTVKHRLPYEGPEFGTPFVADAVRYLQPTSFYQILAGEPEVRYDPYPISPVGIDSYRTGAQYVEERFTIVFPQPLNVHDPWFGEPSVANFFKTLYPQPIVRTEFGTAQVFNSDQHLTLGLGETLHIGLAYVADRDRMIFPSTTSVPVFSVVHQVRNLLPDPPGPQKVEPSGFSSSAFGAHSAGAQTVYALAITPGSVGSPNVVGTTISPRWPYRTESQLGVPVCLYDQTIAPVSLPDSELFKGDSDTFPAKPRVTPHTVYAPSAEEATGQARINHPDSSPHVIDYYHGGGGYSLGGGWPWFGQPAVTNQYRSLYVAEGTVFTQYGTPDVEFRTKFVYPTGIRSLRMGFHVFLGVPQYINLELPSGGIEPTLAVGSPTAAFPPGAPYADSIGFDSFAAGTLSIDLFNRELALTGIPHRGNPEALPPFNTNPWGVPSLGRSPRFIISRTDEQTLWGDAMVSHRIRNVYPIGTDASAVALPTHGSFNDRMRVTRTEPAHPIQGIAPPEMPYGHTIWFANRDLPVQGQNQLRMGTPALSGAASLFPSGWDSSVFGDIDEWEADKIKPHGDDLSTVERPRMAYGLSPTGIDPTSAPVARVAQPIYLAGLPPIGFDGPSVLDEFGCGTLVLSPLPVLSAEAVAEPEVAHV